MITHNLANLHLHACWNHMPILLDGHDWNPSKFLNLGSKWFSTATGGRSIWITEWKSTANQCIAVVQLHPVQKQQALGITHCKSGTFSLASVSIYCIRSNVTGRKLVHPVKSISCKNSTLYSVLTNQECTYRIDNLAAPAVASMRSTNISPW